MLHGIIIAKWTPRRSRSCGALIGCSGSDTRPLGNEPVYQGDTMVGRATAGAYGHVVKKSLALAYVKPESADVGTTLELEIPWQPTPSNGDRRITMGSRE